MKKYDIWNEKKKEIQNLQIFEFNPHTREIWWCSLGINLGSEQNGVGDNFERPILIIRKLSTTTFMVLPMSTKKKIEVFQYKILVKDTDAYVLLDQVKVIDLRRFIRKIEYLNKNDFLCVIDKFKSLL